VTSAAKQPASAVLFILGSNVRGSRLTFGLADLLTDRDRLADQASEAVVLGDLSSGPLDGCTSRDDADDGFASYRMSQEVRGAMAASVPLGTVAGRLAALPIPFYQGTRAHIADLGELGFDLVPFELEGFQKKGGHMPFSSGSIMPCQTGKREPHPSAERRIHNFGVVHPSIPLDF
jgi:hypothetical protein